MRLPRYTVQEIKPLPGFDRVVATALNNFGQVVGYCLPRKPEYLVFNHGGPPEGQAFFWQTGPSIPRDSEMKALQGFNDFSHALGINDRGDVVGIAAEDVRNGLDERDYQLAQRPLLWVGAPAYRLKGRGDYGVPDVRPLRLPGVENGWAQALNEKREIVGSPAALWRPADAHRMKYKALPLPERGKELRVVGINSRGQRIACSLFSSREPLIGEDSERAFWGEGGTWSPLSTPGLPPKATSAPCDLNDAGVVVGWASRSGWSQRRPWIWREGKGEPLSERFGEARGINNAGQIVGVYREDAKVGIGVISLAFLWQEDQLIELHRCVPGGTRLDEAIAINEKGQILTANCLLTPR